MAELITPADPFGTIQGRKIVKVDCPICHRIIKTTPKLAEGIQARGCLKCLMKKQKCLAKKEKKQQKISTATIPFRTKTDFLSYCASFWDGAITDNAQLVKAGYQPTGITLMNDHLKVKTELLIAKELLINQENVTALSPYIGLAFLAIPREVITTIYQTEG